MKVANTVQVSPAFRLQAFKAIGAIVLFIFTYITMIFAAFGLVALCLYIGLEAILLWPSRIAVYFLFIGLVVAAGFVVFFLFKFLFKSNKVDRSHLIEIKASDEPELFKMLHEIVEKVGTQFPKRVYLSSEVNASVFYDSSFWNMFFPVQKNLCIGMGLVNSVTVEELKGILSHEFGHFSQHSLKIGSYVYQANKIIYNLLYDSDEYEQRMKSWSEISHFLSIPIMGTTKIIEGIKWVLTRVSTILNNNDLALSREMEFHADAVAVNVVGSQPAISALLRSDLADTAWNNVLSFYNTKFGEGKIPENIFKDHLFMMQFLGTEYKLSIDHHLPQVTLAAINRFHKSKLVIEDQWTSHPSILDRVSKIAQLGVVAEKTDNRHANVLFSTIDKTHQLMTQRLFESLIETEQPIKVTSEEFAQAYKHDYQEYAFPALYNGYYDQRDPLYFDINTIEDVATPSITQNLFADEQLEIVYSTIALESDLTFIKQIAEGMTAIQSFDYDGVRYSNEEAATLVPVLEQELALLNEQLLQNDRRIYRECSALEKATAEEHKLEQLYQPFFRFKPQVDVHFNSLNQLAQALEFVLVETPYSEIPDNFIKVKALEVVFKEQLWGVLEEAIYQPFLTDEVRKNWEEYVANEWIYYANYHYNSDLLNKLMEIIDEFNTLLLHVHYTLKRDLLTYQADLIASSSVSDDLIYL